MRTAIIILSGLLIWAVSFFLARRYGKPGGSAVEDTTLAFVTIWLLASVTNMWIGITQAGYSLHEELPVFAVIFGLPAAVAAIARKRWS